MNDNDMNNMIKKAQEMISNNQIPDELKNMVANMQKNSNNNQNSNNNYHNANNNYYNRSNNTNTSNKPDYNKYSSTYSQKNNFNDKSSNINYNNNQNNSQNPENNINLNNISELLKNFQSNNSNTTNSANSEHSDFPNIDMETMMRIQNIMSKMKSAEGNDDMSKLLISLKPYLRDEKKSKIDEYIKLIKMGKLTQMFESFGGDKS